jgi:hypothetical protein
MSVAIKYILHVSRRSDDDDICSILHQGPGQDKFVKLCCIIVCIPLNLCTPIMANPEMLYTLSRRSCSRLLKINMSRSGV